VAADDDRWQVVAVPRRGEGRAVQIAYGERPAAGRYLYPLHLIEHLLGRMIGGRRQQVRQPRPVGEFHLRYPSLHHVPAQGEEEVRVTTVFLELRQAVGEVDEVVLQVPPGG